MAAPSTSRTLVLNSWKEIAAYLGRGVRTVQRYERDLALPVRRPRGTSRSAVIALSSELDSWLLAAPTNHDRNRPESAPAAIISLARQSTAEGAQLRDRCHALRAAHQQAIHQLINSLNGMVQGLHRSSSLRQKGPRSDFI